MEGESTRIKVLDHLGGGKLIVDIKGHRVVANTDLMLEKNEEFDVTVRNIGDKVILQLISNAQHNISIEQGMATKASLGNIMHQLMTSLEKAEGVALSTLSDTLKELLKKVQKLILNCTK